MKKIEFKIIQNSDYSDEIRNILNDEEMESLVQVTYEKVPNLFESLQKDSEKTPIIVAGIDVKTGYLVGVGACSIFKNNIGYLNSFRIKKEYRNKVNFGKAYEMLITEAKKLGVKNIVTTILEENKIAQKILTKRRKSMPIYEFYKNIVFFSLKNVKKCDLIVKDEEILNYGNFEIHLKNKTNKKYVVKDYKKIYKFLYKFRKVIAFFGYPEMPEINKISNFLYTDFVLKGKNADEKKNKNEFRKAVKFVQNKGYNCDFFMIGSYENSFLEKNLDKMKVFKYKSKMYKVFYEKIENVERDNNFRNENIEILFWNL
ncbi:GNAT family N-acetyltransferase [uncultured Leptotrichia sp.]|uniref:GNAT family N-acetyltransferase n=1 Tax=uncultured Leptotrichia sp. TaxID=159271 RepID=UPI0025EB58AA|nr:GNAT family N-acetyltransferase [uncultured Leptotrichia sp.]